MLLAGDQFDSDAIDRDLFRQLGAKALAFVIRRTTGTAILHEAFAVDGAEVATGGDLSRLEGVITAEGFEETTAKLQFDGIDAKEGQVPGAGTGGHAGRQQLHPTQG